MRESGQWEKWGNSDGIEAVRQSRDAPLDASSRVEAESGGKPPHSKVEQVGFLGGLEPRHLDCYVKRCAGSETGAPAE
jgi:hypothetical protein